jgi:hypothetical protein
MTPEIQAAFREVQRHFPQVNVVLFLPDGTWRYFDTNGEMPSFHRWIDPRWIDIDILEAALDSLGETPLPAVFIDSTVEY